MPPIAICIPIRDEAAELPHLFAALDRLEHDGADTVHVCLMLDGCTDASATLAAGYRRRSPFRVRVEEVATATANAGRARHRAMMLGARAVGEGGLLLTTDADSTPAPSWLRSMAAGLRRADVVAGRVLRAGDRPNALQDRVETYYDALFAMRRRLDPVPWEAPRTHHHAGGANMGFTVEAYRASGGFAPVANGEDSRLVDDAARAGLRVRRDAASLVHTSDRREGRASAGLACALRRLDGADPAAIRVARPRDAAWQYRMQAVARAAHADDRLDILAAAVGLASDHVHGVARDCPNGEAFAMRIVPAPPAGMREVALADAEAELAALAAVRQRA